MEFNDLNMQEHKVMVLLAMALAAAGYSVFRFDFSGNGESEGMFQFANYHKEVEDLRAVVEHFSTVENRKTAAIVGHSKGGNVVLMYASKYHDIDVVLNISGRFSMGQGIQKRLGLEYMERAERDGYINLEHKNGNVYRVTIESLIERKNIDMKKVCGFINKKCRVVTIHGDNDTVVYRKDVRKFEQWIKNHKLHTIPGASHGYAKHQTELAAAVVFFIHEYVQLPNAQE